MQQKLFASGREKTEARDWMIQMRVHWLLSPGEGPRELLREVPDDFFDDFVPLLTLAAKQNDNAMGYERVYANALAFAKSLECQARVQAERWANQHIDEVWARRRDPDYIPPWEKNEMDY